ncbi:chemotaxis protein MotA [Desulfosarcina alkanivorans]|uniref:Chemotaxis protein MotA n=1 Tax=Desulfosarcina alkanivorans TaxID=571177 RepID=A0A5K7YMB1_9BACT|nr:chemotaxis protein MotA [Desulfosarcina alkanivorans]
MLVGTAVFFLFARNIMGDIPLMVNFKSGALVLLGTIVGGLLTFPVHTPGGFLSSLRGSLKPRSRNLEDLVQQIVALARLKRVAGLWEMNRKIDTVGHPVLRRGFQMILDNHDRQRVEMALKKEINLYLDHLQIQFNVVSRLARLAPVFGFVGTIIGLINVLNHIGSSEQIGQGMAAALLTTFYGLLFANFLFLPLAGRVAETIRRETMMLNVIFDGLVAVCDKRPPLEIAHHLKSYADADLSRMPSTSRPQRFRWHIRGRSAGQQEMVK